MERPLKAALALTLPARSIRSSGPHPYIFLAAPFAPPFFAACFVPPLWRLAWCLAWCLPPLAAILVAILGAILAPAGSPAALLAGAASAIPAVSTEIAVMRLSV